MVTIDADQRRARLGIRHRLARPARDVETVAGDLVGLHSSDPIAVYLAARSRVKGFTVDDLERSLYEHRSLVRMLGMRRTMFVVPVDLAAVIDASCTKALALRERKLLLKLLADQNITANPPPWLDEVEASTMATLAKRGEATASELTKEVPELGLKLRFGEGKTWEGTVGISTRLLFLLATEGRIVRGRPLGSWISSQYRWVQTDDWVDGGLPAIDAVDARADLVRRWLRSFGPGTVTDLKWWTGWTVRDTRQTLDEVGAVEIQLDDGVGYVLSDDTRRVEAPTPWAALLPGLDPTVMGWKDRAWYLGDHARRLFDRNGNAGPTVWLNGRVVGGWAQRVTGEIAIGLLEPVGRNERRMIDREAEHLREWLGEVRITPRFRTPMERELSA